MAKYEMEFNNFTKLIPIPDEVFFIFEVQF